MYVILCGGVYIHVNAFVEGCIIMHVVVCGWVYMHAVECGGCT